MRLKRSHKTNPEVVWRRPDLDVYRPATRRRKDVRVSSKYLKISSRNAGDPLLIKTAGSTCAFPGLLRNPPLPYIYIYIYMAYIYLFLSISSIRARDLSTNLVIIFREGTCKGNKGSLLLDNWFRRIFISLPLSLSLSFIFSWFSNGIARKYTLYSVIYTRSSNPRFGFGNWSPGRRTTTCFILVSIYSRRK